MKYNILLIFLLTTSLIFAQKEQKIIGRISYLSSQNVYVKFPSTEGISKGDTLFSNINGKLTPVIKVKFLSSISVSGNNISSQKLKVGDKIIAIIKIVSIIKQKSIANLKSEVRIENKNKPAKKYAISSEYKTIDNNSSFSGRFAVSTYANFSNLNSTDYVRWRYTLSLKGDRINNSNYSFDSYISFNYRSTDWVNVKSNIGNALKIYSLSIKYNFNENTTLVLGRKINPVVTNISAIDGLQFESKIGQLKYGVIAGSRPNFSDYGLDSKLFEYGVYLSQSSTAGFGNMQNSIAIFQQTNNFKTDRRFLYFQHNSHFVKNVSLFFSSEIDLYKRVNRIAKSTFSLTGLFTSLRYRPSRFVSISASYDNRKNVIYYETYKSFADSLLNAATRQGLRLRVNLRPFNRLSFHFTYGYRFMQGDPRKTNNFSAGFSYSRVPFISSTISAAYNNLKTNYMNGRIINTRLSKDIFNGKAFLGLGYRNIKYKFIIGAANLVQNIFSLDFTWRIFRRLNINISYEGVLESTNSYGRVYFNITKRF